MGYLPRVGGNPLLNWRWGCTNRWVRIFPNNRQHTERPELKAVVRLNHQWTGFIVRKASSGFSGKPGIVRKALPFFVLMMLSISGCTSLGGVGKAGNAADKQSTAPVLRSTLDANGQPVDGVIRHDTVNARVAQLWAQAERSRFSGDDDLAARYILQALELEPGDSVLLSRAAELQLGLGEAVLAESYAIRSNSVSDANRSLLLRNWLIIEHAREVRGDLLGVRTAHKMVQQLR